MAAVCKAASLFIMLWIGTTLPARADDATAIVRNLGTVPSADSDERLAQKLFALRPREPR